MSRVCSNSNPEILCCGFWPWRFQLHSRDAGFLRRAQRVLWPWSDRRACQVLHWEAQAQDAHWVFCEGFRRSLFGDMAMALRAIEYRAVFQLSLRSAPWLAFHAALVRYQERGVMLVGIKESGKSTLASAMWQRGWDLLGDDLALVNSRAGRARSAPRRVSLRPGSRQLLGETLWRQIRSTPSHDDFADEHVLFHPGEVRGQSTASSTVDLAAIVLLDGPAGLSRLNEAEGLFALMPHASLVGGAARAIRRLTPLADRVPIYRLGRLELPQMCEQLERVLSP